MWELDYKESFSAEALILLNRGVGEDSDSPLDCMEIQPVHLKEISPEYSLEGLMLKLKLQYFGHRCEELTYLKRPWSWKRLKAGGEGDNRGWGGWMASPTQWTWVLSTVWELVMDREAWRTVLHGVPKSRTQLSGWTSISEATLNCAVHNVHVHVLQPCFCLTSDRACGLFPRDGPWWSVTRRTPRPLRTQREPSRCPTRWTACRAFSAWSPYSCWPSTWLCWEVTMWVMDHCGNLDSLLPSF